MTQTITVASIKIPLNIDELKKNGEFARNELNRISRVVRESETPFQKMAKDVALLDRAFAAGGISAQTYNQAIDKLSKQHGISAIYAEQEAAAEKKLADARKHTELVTKEAARMEKMLADANRQVTETANQSVVATNNQASAIGSIRNMAAGFIGLTAAANGAKSAITKAAEMETARISFEVMTNSAAKTEELMLRFRELDIQSPINMNDFMKAGKTLLQFGVTAESVPAALRSMSAISLGNTEQFQSLALAFGQVNANGRLMGQEVLQMVNAGFNPLQEISRTTGVSVAELRKQMEAGSISAKMVADAFRSATESGGLFAGMNERLEQTMAGQWSKLQGDITVAATAIGTALNPVLMESIRLLRDMIAASGDFKLSEGGVSMFSSVKSLLNDNASLLHGIRTLSIDSMLAYRDAASEAELDRQAKIQHSIWMEGERKKKLDEQKKLADELAAAEKKRSDAVEASAKKQAVAIDDIKALRKEYDKLTMSPDALKEKERKDKGFTDQDLKIASNIEKMIAAEKEKKAIADEIASIEKNSMTEREKALAESARLAGLMSQLSPEQQAGKEGQMLQQRQQQIAADFAKSQMSDFAANIAPALKSGTVEAFKFIQGQNAKSQEAAAMKKIQEDMLAEMKKQSEQNANAPRLQFARV